MGGLQILYNVDFIQSTPSCIPLAVIDTCGSGFARECGGGFSPVFVG